MVVFATPHPLLLLSMSPLFLAILLAALVSRSIAMRERGPLSLFPPLFFLMAHLLGTGSCAYADVVIEREEVLVVDDALPDLASVLEKKCGSECVFDVLRAEDGEQDWVPSWPHRPALLPSCLQPHPPCPLYLCLILPACLPRHPQTS